MSGGAARLDFDDAGVIHLACPERHPFGYITGKGFGWCPKCEWHFAATLEAERVAEEMEQKGRPKDHNPVRRRA